MPGRCGLRSSGSGRGCLPNSLSTVMVASVQPETPTTRQLRASVSFAYLLSSPSAPRLHGPHIASSGWRVPFEQRMPVWASLILKPPKPLTSYWTDHRRAMYCWLAVGMVNTHS
jgi:hypothetical protein